MGKGRTASTTAHLLGCQYAYRDDVVIPEDPPDAVDAAVPRAKGTRIHANIHVPGSMPLLEGEQPYVDAAALWLKDNGNPDVSHEIAYDWDGVTATEIGVGRESYSKARPTSIFTGTADIVLDFEDKVGDWKTSERSARSARMQLLSLALLSGRRSVVAIELCEDGGYVEHCAETLSDAELSEHATKLREAIANIPTSVPVAGPHCSEGYCPLRGSCPAFTEAVESAVAELVPNLVQLKRKITDPIVDEQGASVAVLVLALLEGWVKEKKKEVQTFVRGLGGSLMLDATTEYREIESTKTGVRAKEALALCQELGASNEQLADLTYVTRFSAFRRINRKAK